MNKMRIQRVFNEKIIANIKWYSVNKMFNKVPYTQKAGHKYVSNYYAYYYYCISERPSWKNLNIAEDSWSILGGKLLRS